MGTELFKKRITEHAYYRLNQRLSIMLKCCDITTAEKENIEKNLINILNYDFDAKSYGIMFGRFEINNELALVTRRHPSGVYYTIDSFDKFDIIKDSTGNEFWGIVRNKRLITAFLRKTVQRNTAEKERNDGGLGVDVVIDDFDTFIVNSKPENDI